MKAKKRKALAHKPSPPGPRPAPVWVYLLGCFAAVCVTMQAYSPSWNGPFLFDDDYLPFNTPNFPTDIRFWISGVRPLLMLTYWINFRFSGLNTAAYHLVNFLIHSAAGVLAFFILRKILELAGVVGEKRRILALFGAGIFLLHPVQTESVAYVASRSECLSGMFFLAAAAAYLCRGSAPISWGRAATVMLLAGCALASKEHTAVLPVLLLLTDYYWNPGFSWEGARRNWRFYVPVALAGAAGMAFVWRVLRQSASAGFALKDFTWYQYFFTECRALLVYLRLFVFPVGQTIDYDFPISHTILEHGALVGLAVLLALAGAAWYWRRRYPLASYGVLVFLLLMAPTSSFVPIRDPLAERRMYLAILCLVLIALEFLRRLRVPLKSLAAGLAAVVLLAGVLTYARDKVWRDPITLWQDTVAKSPRKARAHFQLAYAYYQRGRCGQAVAEYARTAQLQPPAYDLLVDWAQAYDCANRPDEALAKLRQAATLERSAHAFSQIGMIYAKQAKWPEALEALDTAEKINPNYAMTYVYRGKIHMRTGEIGLAIQDYERALSLDPRNADAAEDLVTARRLLSQGR